jgi:predicted GH43/DUF377 family glycosyl hydrolase
VRTGRDVQRADVSRFPAVNVEGPKSDRSKTMAITRFAENPLIRPADVRPSRDDFEVVCAFNAGCTRIGHETLLLLRVAERPAHAPDELVAPVLHADDSSRGIHILRVKKTDPHCEEIDARMFMYRGQRYLTSISHLRAACSRDGRTFVVNETPAMVPERREEEFGIEDPRITPLGDQYAINYSAVSRYGIATALAATRDFKTFERRGVIFAPDNRNVTLFPEEIGGHYACFHRPMGRAFGRQDVWFASSPDLIHWGRHRFVCSTRPGMWDSFKVGAGAIPIKTDRGWLTMYHGADQHQRYCLGCLLTDLEQPYRLIARSADPILAPEAEYERKGFCSDVVFTCGAVAEPDGRVIIYYGSSDEYTCGAETTVGDLLATLA